MSATISLEALTEDEIERLSLRRFKQEIGFRIEVYASTNPNHAEVVEGCECTLCRNGVSLDRAGKAVCIRCNRASKRVERSLNSIRKEERVLRQKNAESTVDVIKRRSLLQMRGGRARRGPTIDSSRMRIVAEAVRAEVVTAGSAIGKSFRKDARGE